MKQSHAMSHEDLQSLLGAYALDALDDDELAEVEAHLDECPECRAEVAAHRNTASLFAMTGGEAPPHIWDRIAGELGLDEAPLEETPPPPLRLDDHRFEQRPAHLERRPARLDDHRRDRPAEQPEYSQQAAQSNVVPFARRSTLRRVAMPAVTALAAAAAAAAIVLGVNSSHLQHKVNHLSAAVSAGGLQQATAAAVLNPDHEAVQLTSDTTGQNVQVVILPDGTAYLTSSDLPALSAQQTYQLWGLASGKAVSLGLLGSHPQLAAFRVDQGVSRLMVTAEPTGGVPQPTTPVLIQGNVPA